MVLSVSQVQRSNTRTLPIESEPLVAFHDAHWYTENLIVLSPHFQDIATYKPSWDFKYNHWICLEFSMCNYFNKIPLTTFNWMCLDFSFCNYFSKIPLTTFTCIILLNFSTFSECGYSCQPSKLIICSLISVFHIGLVIASPQANTTDLDAITKPIWKTLINNPIFLYFK